MAAKLGVLIIHGMGNPPMDYAIDYIKSLEKRIFSKKSDYQQIAWEPIFWSPVIQDKEDKLWQKLYRNNDMRWVKLRKFVINALGDAVAYHRSSGDGKQSSVYNGIQKVIGKSVAKLKGKLNSEEAPVIILGYSLGCYIISNYIWDLQHGKSNCDNPFELLQTIVGIVTYGCNIPLLTLELGKIDAIAFPNSKLPQKLKDSLKGKISWENYYDPDDILGYPLKPLSNSYNEVVKADIPLNIGNILTSWNPFSHSDYEGDRDLLDPIAKKIKNILEQLNRVPSNSGS